MLEAGGRGVLLGEGGAVGWRGGGLGGGGGQAGLGGLHPPEDRGVPSLLLSPPPPQLVQLGGPGGQFGAVSLGIYLWLGKLAEVRGAGWEVEGWL